MKKIFSVNVFGQKVPVYLKKGLADPQSEEPLMGYCEFGKTDKIVIDSDLKVIDFTETLAHEMIHIMFNRLNIEINYRLEEQLCEATRIPLFENLKITLLPSQLQALKDHQSS